MTHPHPHPHPSPEERVARLEAAVIALAGDALPLSAEPGHPFWGNQHTDSSSDKDKDEDKEEKRGFLKRLGDKITEGGARVHAARREAEREDRPPRPVVLPKPGRRFGLAATDTQEFVGDEPGHPFRGNQYTSGSGGRDDDNTVATDKGGRIHKADAAARMYGEGSRQHKEALRRFGSPPPAGVLRSRPTNLASGAVIDTLEPSPAGRQLGKENGGHVVRLPRPDEPDHPLYLSQDRPAGPFVTTTVRDLASAFETERDAEAAARSHDLEERQP